MIETKNLTRKFGNLTAVENLTLQVKEGEVFGFLGPNAAGKTTTVRMLCCLIAPTSGEARIGDYSVGSEDDCLAIRKLVGLLPENVCLYENLGATKTWTSWQTLRGSPEKRQENIEHLLKLLGIWERRVKTGQLLKGPNEK
jgi:ABC-2 type transport system ATP-binding protein